MEDAALLRPESGPALVFTVDFITPIVDEPEAFGAIAAANSISDVYAMGGEPQVALAVCGFPPEHVSMEVLARIFQGGRDKAAEAGCAIVGGHTVEDPELKYGLCVIGRVDPERTFSHSGAEPGDRLVLTKPIGFGIAAQALKKGLLSPRQIEQLVTLMTTLNKDAKDAALAAGVRAATDVTGFGLLGHLRHLLLGSDCSARLYADSVPVIDFVTEFADKGIVPAGSKNNLAYVAPTTRFDAALDESVPLLLADAQTSGGLLLVVAPTHLDELLAGLEARGAPAAALVGEVCSGEPGQIEVLSGSPR